MEYPGFEVEGVSGGVGYIDAATEVESSFLMTLGVLVLRDLEGLLLDIDEDVLFRLTGVAFSNTCVSVSSIFTSVLTDKDDSSDSFFANRSAPEITSIARSGSSKSENDLRSAVNRICDTKTLYG